jgi:hypothetical protein
MDEVIDWLTFYNHRRLHSTRSCSFGQSFWRNLAGLFVFDWLSALGKKRMRLGDMIASTEVVNSK